MSLLLVRGVNILRNRKEQITHGVTSTTSHDQTESRVPDFTDDTPEKKEEVDGSAPPPTRKSNLAARRGKNLLAIDLGAGTYFIPATGSATTTPIHELPPSRRGSTQANVDGMLDGRSTQHLLPYTESPTSATSSVPAGSSGLPTPFSPFGPSSPTSEKLAELSQQTRRKSSVTFADAIPPMARSPHRSPAVHTPALEMITASPLLGNRLSLFDALASNRSETARSIEKGDLPEEKDQSQ